ncbi:MAG: chorismate-binding protein [Planctomycetota bacterium]
MRYAPDFDTFAQLAADGYTTIPVHRRLLGDALTPVSAFARVRGNGHAFLLESVVGGERVGRHSFIAFDPVAVYEPTESTSDPLAELQAQMGDGRFWRDPSLPSFTGGAVGFAGYDLMRFYEPEKLGTSPADDRGLPDVHFGIYDRLLIFDHVDKTVRAVANASIGGDVRAAYDAACRRCDDLVQRLSVPSPLTLGEIELDRPLSLEYEATLDQAGYESAVVAGKEYIAAGDIFQFVPSLRLRVQSGADPLDVYRALRVINPSPFMFYLETPSATLIGSSPEILCRVEDGVVESRPLAGTRHRGKTAEQDAKLEAELRADPKDTAEHAMLVDLHRNDVGRVAEIGTVELREAFTVERYSHVMHLSSDVIGRLKAGMTALDALRVSLPVGTVSGAPKIRAMQIIDELEPVKRGPYGGAVGYLDYAGNLDTCIALRTIVHHGELYDVQAGAGVVADSVPTSEWRECMNKAEALLRAVDVAQAGFDG